MCFQDIQMGRNTTTTRAVVALAPSPARVLSRDAKRLSILIGTCPDSGFSFGSDSTGLSGNEPTVKAGDSPLTLTVKDHGRMVTEDFWMQAEANSSLVIYTVSMIDDPK